MIQTRDRVGKKLTTYIQDYKIDKGSLLKGISEEGPCLYSVCYLTRNRGWFL